ncbi:hypothetical protein K438DRAFT_1977482 [Mycena galopus ATCC 62051]|nr:hypothetical protein K438DRAFT_1977482 [Mycena galopus ATCC 62051]
MALSTLTPTPPRCLHRHPTPALSSVSWRLSLDIREMKDQHPVHNVTWDDVGFAPSEPRWESFKLPGRSGEKKASLLEYSGPQSSIVLECSAARCPPSCSPINTYSFNDANFGLQLSSFVDRHRTLDSCTHLAHNVDVQLQAPLFWSMKRA